MGIFRATYSIQYFQYLYFEIYNYILLLHYLYSVLAKTLVTKKDIQGNCVIGPGHIYFLVTPYRKSMFYTTF